MWYQSVELHTDPVVLVSEQQIIIIVCIDSSSIIVFHGFSSIELHSVAT